jgi:hypothetical protein
MFWMFLQGANERLPLTAEKKTHLSLHVVRMELYLNRLPNNAIHVTGLSGKDGGTVKQNAVSRVDTMFSYG